MTPLLRRRVLHVSLGLSIATVSFAGLAAEPSGNRPPEDPGLRSPAASPPQAPLRAALPAPLGEFAPAQVRTRGEVTSHEIADVDACEGCHADVAQQWRTSAHRHASFSNPVYRAVVDGFRKEVGEATSRFCGACHDPSLLVDGAMDGEVSPTDRRGHAGVTCGTCHSIVHAHADGNGSYTLTAEPIVVPSPAGKATIPEHVAAAARPALRSFALCASCHRAYLDPSTGNAYHLVGQDDVTPWQRSEYAGSQVHRIDDPIARQDCRGCHMPLEDAPLGDAAATNGKVASHRFLGAHTYLAAMRGDEDTLSRSRSMLRGAASIDVAAASGPTGEAHLPADGAPVRPGETWMFDVVVRNTRVGHRFPGGTMDAQDTWIEVTITDVSGNLVAEAGLRHAKGEKDPSAHVLRSLVVDANGLPVSERQTNRFRATVYNHTIPPRDVQVVSYSVDLPDTLAETAFPLKIEARLLHRSRALPLQRIACEAVRSPRGQAFWRAGAALDACVEQPITQIAESAVWLGDGAPSVTSDRPTWRRLYEHGLGLTHALQERVGDARPSLFAALDAPGTTPAERAMIFEALGAVSARQSRVDEAMAWLDRAGELTPLHPAIAYQRGAAQAEVWRWPLAERYWAESIPVEQAPLDDEANRMLALAAASTGDLQTASEAAARGLALQPRDVDLLRIQALSLAALDAPPDVVFAAQTAHAAVLADPVPAVRGKCSAKVPGCANERIPVHTHTLRTAF